jgi:hypothetical protein
VANAISATLYDKLNYNFRDVALVAGISRAPNVMVLHPSDACRRATAVCANQRPTPPV